MHHIQISLIQIFPSLLALYFLLCTISQSRRLNTKSWMVMAIIWFFILLKPLNLSSYVLPILPWSLAFSLGLYSTVDKTENIKQARAIRNVVWKIPPLAFLVGIYLIEKGAFINYLYEIGFLSLIFILFYKKKSSYRTVLRNYVLFYLCITMGRSVELFFKNDIIQVLLLLLAYIFFHQAYNLLLVKNHVNNGLNEKND